MNNFEKIELIVKGRLEEGKAELERCKKKEPDPYGPNPMYINEVQHDVGMLQQILCDIDAIKRNHHSVRDELLLKMYGPLKKPV